MADQRCRLAEGSGQTDASGDWAAGIIPVTNAIEALNAKLRRAVRARGHFPTDEAAMKLLFLVLNYTEAASAWRRAGRLDGLDRAGGLPSVAQLRQA